MPALFRSRCFSLAWACVLALVGTCVQAADDAPTLTLRNHRFSPQELTVPAGQKIRLTVINEDATPAEFESKPLNREKLIPAKSRVVVPLGPLKPGRYPFVEEFHEKESGAQGILIAE